MNIHHRLKELKKIPDYIEPKKYSKENFPASELNPSGMKVLNYSLDYRTAVVHQDVIYAHKSSVNLHLNVIEPGETRDPSNKERFPLLVWVQGSGWQKQNIGYHISTWIRLAEKGYVIAIVEYRCAPKNHFPDQIKDLNSAIRFMLLHAQEFHVNPNKYEIGGESSGAHTAIMALVTRNLQEFSDEDIEIMPIKPKACIDYFGPTDLSRMNKVPCSNEHVTASSFEGQFIGGDIYENLDLVKKANPMTYIDDKLVLPPILIMHGNKDRIVPFEQSVLLYKKLRDTHHKVVFYEMKNADHGSDAFYKKETMKITQNFIDSNLK